MKKDLVTKIIFLFVLLLIYGLSFSQYLVASNKYSEALNLNTQLKDTLSELKVNYESLTNLKTIRERAINELHMHYAEDAEKLILEDEK